MSYPIMAYYMDLAIGATPAIIACADNWVIEPFVGQKPEFSTKVYETDIRVGVVPPLGSH